MHAKISLLSFRNVTSGPAGSMAEARCIINQAKSNFCIVKLIKIVNECSDTKHTTDPSKGAWSIRFRSKQSQPAYVILVLLHLLAKKGK